MESEVAEEGSESDDDGKLWMKIWRKRRRKEKAEAERGGGVEASMVML